MKLTENSTGFSLVEVLISLVIGGIIASGAVSLVSLSVRSNRNIAMANDKIELVSSVQHLLSDPNTCTMNLANQTLDLATFAEKDVEFYYPKNETLNPQALLKGDRVVSDARFRKIDIESIKVFPYAQVSVDNWLIVARIRSRKTSDGANLPVSIRDAVAQVKIDPLTSQVKNCVAVRESTVSAEDSEQSDEICALGTNGAKLYNPETHLCDLPNPSASPPPPTIVLNDTICAAASGGSKVYDSNTKSCVGAAILEVVGNATSCACPEGMNIWWVRVRVPSQQIPDMYCETMENGNRTCANYGKPTPNPTNPRASVCVYAEGINMTGATCTCICTSGRMTK